MSTLPNFAPIVAVTKPRLSVRTVATFLRLPAVQQVRILHDQKYPKQAPQVFKQPYYQPALNSVREYMENGSSGLPTARGKLQAISPASRRMHSIRVLEQFVACEHTQRTWKPISQKRYHTNIGELELRLSPDLIALEGDEERFIYFNLKAEKYDGESARMTLEIAHWLLEQNGIDIKPDQIEFIDLFSGVLHKTGKRRIKTIKLLEENAKFIEMLWPSIDP